MKRYFISYMSEKEKKQNLELYHRIKEYGEQLDSKWNGDYLIEYYRYHSKIWELWHNMELGIISEIREN